MNEQKVLQNPEQIKIIISITNVNTKMLPLILFSTIIHSYNSNHQHFPIFKSEKGKV